MQHTELNAEIRQKCTSGVARRLRHQGVVPAVVYGKALKNQNVTVTEKEIDKILRTKLGRNTLIRLKVKGGEDQNVLIKDYQGDVLTRRVTHVDFMVVREDQQVTVYVPVRIEGKAAGVAAGGILEVTTREVELLCKVGQIPEVIIADVTPLNIGQNLHLSDLKLPTGVSVREKYNPTIVLVHEPEKEEVAAPAAVTVDAAAVPATAQKAEGAQAAAPAAAGKDAKPAAAGAKPDAGKAAPKK